MSAINPGLSGRYLSQANGVMSDVTQEITTRAVDPHNQSVALQWEHKGTNSVTGEQYHFCGATTLKIEGGVVVEHRDFFDPSVLMTQFKRAHKHKQKVSKL